MIIWDTENNIGIEVHRSFKKVEISLVEQKPVKGDIAFFFPDPFYMTIRFFDFYFGGTRAKKACEVELSSLEMFQGDKYLIWTPRRKGTSIAMIYEGDYIKSIVSEGADYIIFKPVCLLHLCDDGYVVVDVGQNTVSCAYRWDENFFRLAFFKYSHPEDIRNQIMIFLASLKMREDIKFKVCGRAFNLFPFEAYVVKPSEVFGVGIEDPSYTSLFCAALGKYPDIKLKLSDRRPSIEMIMHKSFGISALLFFILSSAVFPLFFESSYLNKKMRKLISESSDIFSAVFPDKKAQDYYSQMKVEYLRYKKFSERSSFHIFAKFAESVSAHIIRVEDFSLDSDEISAQLLVKEISDVEKVKESLGKFIRDVKVTSTVRSREGDSYIIRVSGKI